MEQIIKIYRLTEEEVLFFKEEENSFWKKYNLHFKIPLYKRVASALQTLAVGKLLGCGYKGIDIKNEKEAIEHHFKACKYDPSITNKYSAFKKLAGI